MEEKKNTIKELKLKIKVLELEIEKLKLQGRPPEYIPYLIPTPPPTPDPIEPYSPYTYPPVTWCHR